MKYLKMLERLYIENYALIEKAEINFREGFTVITGETGSGKSIMLDALSLLTGSRADTKAMADKDKKTIVEANFSQNDLSIRELFHSFNIDWDKGEIILRREITPAGKSRAFINDTPVNLSVLNVISSRLIDIHSQHENSLLNQSGRQLSIIDAFGATEDALEEYTSRFKSYVELRNKIKKIRETQKLGKENEEFLRFRLEQLDKIKPRKGELEVLEREAEILGDADRIKSALNEANGFLAYSGASALKSVQSAASVLGSIDLDLLNARDEDNLAERLNSLKIELRDISDTLEVYMENINSDPEKLEKIRGRIETLYEAMKRFKVKDEEELVTLYQKLKEELEGLNADSTDVAAMEKTLKEQARELKEKAEILSEKREQSALMFARVVTEKLIPLGMPNVRFEVKLEKGKLTSEGQDTVTFYCSFNKSHSLQPVSEIASGGEISRLMLTIKSVMAGNMQLPTIIFDEIDTGVSGEIAHKMGRMMKEMATAHQVLSVTHLPQVAAIGDSHLKVYKTDENEKTVSHVRMLESEERVIEIAGMLSGDSINSVALENAKVLLNSEI